MSSPAWVVWRAGALVSVVVVGASVGVHYWAYRLQVASGEPAIAALTWFDVNAERNVPTAWSTLILLSSALVSAVLALRRSAGSGWLLISLVTGYLALDESTELHERLAPAGSAMAGDALHFTWVVPGAVAAAVVGAVLLRQLRRQPGDIRRRLIVAGALYVAGGLVAETVSGFVLREQGARELYIAVTAVEELLEMLGATLLLATLVGVRPPPDAHTPGAHPGRVMPDEGHACGGASRLV